MIRRLVIIAAFGLLTGCSTGEPADKTNDPFKVSAFRSDGGWGYTIAINGKDYIKQPYIPAVNGKVPFRNEQEALKTGNYVCSLLRSRKLPSLRAFDLVQLGVMPDTLKSVRP